MIVWVSSSGDLADVTKFCHALVNVLQLCKLRNGCVRYQKKGGLFFRDIRPNFKLVCVDLVQNALCFLNPKDKSWNWIRKDWWKSGGLSFHFFITIIVSNLSLFLYKMSTQFNKDLDSLIRLFLLMYEMEKTMENLRGLFSSLFFFEKEKSTNLVYIFNKISIDFKIRQQNDAVAVHH
jgi:hypothetical protein